MDSMNSWPNEDEPWKFTAGDDVALRREDVVVSSGSATRPPQSRAARRGFECSSGYFFAD